MPGSMCAEKTVLITGASGLVGSALVQAALQQGWQVVPVGFRSSADASGCPAYQMDLTQPENAEILFERHNPSLIINCAAIISEALCRDDPERARLVNVELPRRLARMAKARATKLIHISSEAVYGTQGSRPHLESDGLAPSGFYAASKAAADEAVLAEDADALVVRATPVGFRIGSPGGSLAEWIAAQLAAGEAIPGFGNVCFTPVSTAQLADFLFSASLRRLHGVINLSSTESLSKYEFARGLVVALGGDAARVQLAQRDPAGILHQGALGTGRAGEHGLAFPDFSEVLASLLRQRKPGPAPGGGNAGS